MFLNIFVANKDYDFDFWDSFLYNEYLCHTFRNEVRNIVSSKICQSK